MEGCSLPLPSGFLSLCVIQRFAVGLEVGKHCHSMKKSFRNEFVRKGQTAASGRRSSRLHHTAMGSEVGVFRQRPSPSHCLPHAHHQPALSPRWPHHRCAGAPSSPAGKSRWRGHEETAQRWGTCSFSG